jgi:hypothetical protein
MHCNIFNAVCINQKNVIMKIRSIGRLATLGATYEPKMVAISTQVMGVLTHMAVHVGT